MIEDKYAIYLRKSRADLEAEALGEGETLTRHRNILFKLAEKHNIISEQITVYQEVVSGDSISARPEMQRLLNDVYQKKYKGVLVVEVERLARGNTKDQGEVADAFQFSNTKIITPSKVYDPNNEFDQEYFEFGLFMSRREYKTIRRRMEAGREESVAEGNFINSEPPYGYTVERVNKKERKLVVNPDEAPYVKMIFDWFTNEKISTGEIARRLSRMGVPTRSKAPEWGRMSVRNILTNVHYIGKIRWHYTKWVKEYDAETHTMQRKRRIQKNEDVKLFQGKHEPLITEEQFELAQGLFAHQPPVKSHDKLVNKYSGILKCAKCGAAIRYEQHLDYEGKYTHPNSTRCHIKGCRCSDVDDAIIYGLKAYIEDFEVKINSNNEWEQEQHKALIETLEAELGKQEKKRTRLFEAFEDGTYTKEEFVERRQSVLKSIENIKEQIESEKEKAQVPIDYQSKVYTFHQAVDMLKDDSIDAKTQNMFLKSFIDHIEIDSEDLGARKGARPILDIYLK